MFKAVVIWKEKTPDGKFNEVSREEYVGDRAAMVLVNLHGDCTLATFGMPLTETMGCLRRITLHPEGYQYPSDSNKTLIMELQTELSGPDLVKPKVEKHDYYRGILIIMNDGNPEPAVAPLMITEVESLGVIEIVRELQLINMGMQNAMRGMMGGPTNIGKMPTPPFIDPRMRF
jgi:hypothetical protein